MTKEQSQALLNELKSRSDELNRLFDKQLIEIKEFDLGQHLIFGLTKFVEQQLDSFNKLPVWKRWFR